MLHLAAVAVLELLEEMHQVLILLAAVAMAQHQAFLAQALHTQAAVVVAHKTQVLLELVAQVVVALAELIPPHQPQEQLILAAAVVAHGMALLERQAAPVS